MVNNMEVKVMAPAKINLMLDVTGKRDDGYHTLTKENGKIIDSVTGYDEEYTDDEIEI